MHSQDNGLSEIKFKQLVLWIKLCLLPKSYGEVLTSNVFGDRAYKETSVLNEVKRGSS